ncbi:hypothetical protein R5H30_16550 [Sulfitobacter sp. D35]|uniref:hypothetical protein n=1 Tax=Sulfitobacter sp. D35 TaxID=3083252 RepID=UPI00296EE4C3|nr:hypothetical protein [Sulfitobacter sp. D35]MDW4499605.1 hypothetical protein [Sulfitobacter sp. D35]
MLFRNLLIALTLSGLAACAPQIPDSGQGVGFDNSPEAQRARDEALARSRIDAQQPQTVLPPAAPVSSGPLDATGIGAGAGAVPGSAAATAAETQRILVETRPELGSQLPATEAPASPVTLTPQRPAASGASEVGISDENDFGAVAERETIESDAARLQENAAQFEVIAPEALPERTGNEGPNIVAYALQTSNPVGQRVYSRSSLGAASRAARNCAQYASPDKAQMDFLSRGGPERDAKGLDPDGDGYACSWDPRPFRRASQG